MKQKNKSFITGAAVLAAGGLLAKFLGLFFRIPLSQILKSYGSGLYEYAYPLYNTFLSISITGLPVAISRMVAQRVSVDNYAAAYKVFRVSLRALAILGAAISLIMFFSINFMLELFNWPADTYYCIASISLAPFFVSMVSAYRGFFQGMQQMTYSSISQIVDQIGRVSIGLLLALILTNAYGVAFGAAGATFGAVSGAFFSFIFLTFSFRHLKNKQGELLRSSGNIEQTDTAKSILKTLLSISIPVALGSIINTLMELINSATIPSCLQIAGFTQEMATSLVGELGYANTLTNVPLVIGSAISASLVPYITSMITRGENRELIKQKITFAMRVSFLVGLPCAVGLSVLAEPIFALLFKGYTGYRFLRFSAYMTIFTIASSNLQAILQGSGFFYKALRNMIVGALAKVVLNLVLVRIPSLNIYGAIISSIASTALMFILNFLTIRANVGVGKLFGKLFANVLSAGLMGVAAYFSFKLFSGFIGVKLGVVAAIMLSVVVYVVLVLLTKTLTREEIRELRS